MKNEIIALLKEYRRTQSWSRSLCIAWWLCLIHIVCSLFVFHRVVYEILTLILHLFSFCIVLYTLAKGM